MTIVSLWFCGLASGTAGPALLEEGAGSWQTGEAIAILTLTGGFAVANVLAAWGLGRRKRWAFRLAIVIGALYVPIFIVAGALILSALLRRGVKDTYDAECERSRAPATF